MSKKTFSFNVSNIPDGIFETILINSNNNTVVYDDVLEFSGEKGISYITNVQNKDRISGYTVDNSVSPQNGCVISGVVEAYYPNFNGTTNVLVSNTRIPDVINNELSVSFTLYGGIATGSIISQNIDNTSSNREFHIYLNPKMTVVIGGMSTHIDYDFSLDGRYELRLLTDSYELLRDDTIVWSGSLNRGGKVEPTATLLVGARRVNALDSFGFLYTGGINNVVISPLNSSSFTTIEYPLDTQTNTQKELNSTDTANFIDYENLVWVDEPRLLNKVYTYPAGFNLVILGASIMQGSFEGNEAETEALFAALNIDVNIDVKAVGGRKSVDILANLGADLLTAYAGQQATTLVFMHDFGNDISSGAYPIREDQIRENFNAIIDAVEGAGFNLIVSNTTYRIPPASNPSLPYNENVIEPIIRERLPLSVRNNMPVVDLYNLTYNNQSIIGSDGIHPEYPSGREAIRNYVVTQLSTLINTNI